jgi:hypothetical protein
MSLYFCKLFKKIAFLFSALHIFKYKNKLNEIRRKLQWQRRILIMAE